VATRLYGGYVTTLAERFDEALREIQVGYNFEYGSEFEIAICQTLRRALPHKYGICRGFVVDASGEIAGDDIIIYDRARFPTLRLLTDEDYSRKERIPIEAIYAYIEAKHTIDIEGDGDSSLRHSSEQVARVRALCGRRAAVPQSQIGPFMVLDPRSFTPCGREGYPEILNPLFTMILARNVRQKPKQNPLTDPHEIQRILLQEDNRPPTFPDAAILGKDSVILPVLRDPGRLRFRSPFSIEGRSASMCRVCPGIAFGVGLGMLLFALDQIQLGTMGWSHILEDAVEGGLDTGPSS